MLREVHGKGQNRFPDSGDLESEIDGLESTQKVLDFLLEHKAGLAAEISEMNSGFDGNVTSVISPEFCEKGSACAVRVHDIQKVV